MKDKGGWLKIFRETDDWRGFWDSFVLVCAIFNALMIPVTISFMPIWAERSLYGVADNLTNIIFFVDMFIIFNTAIRDKNSEEVMDRRIIAVNYFKGLFVLDFVSSLPWDQMFADIQQIKLLNMIKMIRIARIHRIISKMKKAEDDFIYFNGYRATKFCALCS